MDLKIATGDSKAGTRIADLYPSLAGAYRQDRFAAYTPDAVDGLDLVFCALPHGVSQTVVPEIRGRVGKIVDLGSDFRLRDASLYPQWYGEEHSCPEMLADAAYGLPELFREQIASRDLIASTGCNAATAIFALAPLLAGGFVDGRGLVVNVVTGVSGAGRPPKEHTTFCTVDSDITPYGMLTHRHTPEIEQALTERCETDATVLFTPHLAPLNRGIIATCYGRVVDPSATTETVLEAITAFYADEPFIVVDQRAPSVKATLGANTVHITARVDPRTGTAMAIAVLDNLMKGASGMAVQNANIALGLDERLGLPLVGVYP